MATLLAFLLLLLSYGVGSIRCYTVPVNSTDMLFLFDFKKHISRDPRGALSSWNESVPFCRWNGVTCSRKHPWRVVSLNLFELSLSGTISSSLGNLTLLKELNLSLNSFSGK
uniref:Leucine-rich repeat-containing N-terminal plant-type domain-containing protein n=1 Tax=Oryza punctata TaxID=4537 RepID=A0A0E0K293_ORYPU